MKRIPCCTTLALLVLAGSVAAEETPGFQCMVRRTLLDVLGDEINETTEVNDEILGTVVSGTGHLQAGLSIVPVANPEVAELELNVQGTLVTETSGFKGPVTTSNTGETTLHARTRLLVSDQGIQPLPTLVEATTASQVHSVCTPFRGPLDKIVRRIAWKSICRNQAETDEVASRRAEQSFAQRLDEQLQAAIATANQDLDNYLGPVLASRYFPERVELSTTDGAFFVHATQIEDSLEKPDSLPTQIPDSSVVVHLHQSMISNLAQGMLAGETMKLSQLKAELAKFLGTGSPIVSEDLEITFAEERPLSVIFDEGRLTLAMKCQQLRLGASVYPSMDVKLTYQTATAQGLLQTKLLRSLVVPPDFERSGERTLSESESAARALILSRLETEFQDAMALGPVNVGHFESLSGLFFDDVQLHQGWLNVGLSHSRQAE